MKESYILVFMITANVLANITFFLFHSCALKCMLKNRLTSSHSAVM